MRVLVQRVRRAAVEIAGREHAAIGAGMLVFVGVGTEDGEEDIAWLASKIARLRIFDDDEGVMNRDLVQVGGEALVVSQFTLQASTRKGNRPSYVRAAPEPVSRPLYERFVAALAAALGRPVATGCFGADMQVALVNDGPVTIWIDSRARE
ncbi:D-aminoacyl-tRNA deacylase [uncultured Alistipes sp.]|jgi:D-tyrosyl-tRNA(Tyr) deacylase|uniref:D-aminoacyl-tRNA deacylase n=1 Tax=uncultured Alistipes sp. TaxID=538949 RepID=UPI002603F184|nr:D-aminoacyl-tRNA deacylase [uncultured Alistipes sp.]